MKRINDELINFYYTIIHRLLRLSFLTQVIVLGSMDSDTHYSLDKKRRWKKEHILLNC